MIERSQNTSVLRVEAIIHRRRGSSSSSSSRAASHRAEAFLSRGSAVENGHYVDSRSNSGEISRKKRDPGEKRDGVRGLTLNPDPSGRRTAPRIS